MNYVRDCKANAVGSGIVDLDTVFTVSGDIAEWLVPMLHNVPKGKVPKVFSADLTPALINLMCEPNSPLEAICVPVLHVN